VVIILVLCFWTRNLCDVWYPLCFHRMISWCQWWTHVPLPVTDIRNNVQISLTTFEIFILNFKYVYFLIISRYFGYLRPPTGAFFFFCESWGKVYLKESVRGPKTGALMWHSFLDRSFNMAARHDSTLPPPLKLGILSRSRLNSFTSFVRNVTTHQWSRFR